MSSLDHLCPSLFAVIRGEGSIGVVLSCEDLQGRHKHDGSPIELCHFDAELIVLNLAVVRPYQQSQVSQTPQQRPHLYMVKSRLHHMQQLDAQHVVAHIQKHIGSK